jgi:CRP-like cAMP-binding protein
MIARYLTAADLHDLLMLGKERKYPKSDDIIRPGNWSKTYVYIVKNGIVVTYAETTNDEPFIHMAYGPGDIFPITGLNQRRGDVIRVGAKAETEVELCQIPYADFMKFMQEDLERLSALLKQVVDQFKIYTHRVENLQLMLGRERVAYRFLLFASRFGVKKDGFIEVPRVSRKTLASAVNLREEVLSRELARLKGHGIIAYGTNTVRILDMERLKQQLGKDVTLPFKIVG